MRTHAALSATLGPYVETSQNDTSQSRDLARTLKGVLPCARCGYELKGLSIRSTCPECGLGVRATLLAAVDPAAEELQPLQYPRLLIVGLTAWSVGAFGSGLAALTLRILQWAGVDLGAWQARLSVMAIVGVVLSGLGAIVLIRPHTGTPRANMVRAIIGVCAYAGVAVGMTYLFMSFDPGLTDAPYTRPGVVVEDRHQVRLGIGAATLLIIIMLRPNARMLAARSLVLRNGRVDRQPLYALAAAVGVSMSGDFLLLVMNQFQVPNSEILWSIGSLLIAVGSLLLMIGIVGIVLDCYRVSRVLVEPAPSLRDIIGSPGDEP